VTGDGAVLNLVSDDKNNFELRVRAIPQLRREENRYFGGKPARKRLFAAGYVLRALAT
jgi:hypothetical protein